MLTSRAHGRAGKRLYLYIGDVHLTGRSYTELARGKVWLGRKAWQRELAVGLPEAVAIVIHVVALAPLRAPEAGHVAWIMDDPAVAAEIDLSTPAGPSCGVARIT